MKVALLFFGRLLGFRENYEQFKTLFSDNVEVDFFLSHSKELNEDADVEEFIQLYKPKGILNDPIPFDEEFLLYKRPYFSPTDQYIKNMHAHFTNKARVFQLVDSYMKTTNTKYDFFVSSRIDVLFEGKINLNTIVLENTIYIPFLYFGRGLETECKILHFSGISDMMCIGNYNTIKSYSSILYSCKHYLRQGYPVNPEILTACHVNAMNVNLIRFPLKHYLVKKPAAAS
jgi:hypothetical protein